MILAAQVVVLVDLEQVRVHLALIQVLSLFCPLHQEHLLQLLLAQVGHQEPVALRIHEVHQDQIQFLAPLHQPQVAVVVVEQQL
jgi:hypothetical protein